MKRVIVDKILEGLNSSRMVIVSEGNNDMSTLPLTKFIKDAYKGKTRKGINKGAFEHMLDVVDNSYIEKIDDVKRSAKLFKAAMLHDIPEDTKIDMKELQKKLSLTDDLVSTLKKLSRNIKNDDGTGYIEGILKDEDAIIVKLADRMANLRDLILWIHNAGGLTKSSKYTVEKYLKESPELMDGVKKVYPTLLKEHPDSPIATQYLKLKQLMVDLKKLYEQVKNNPLLEGMFQNYDVKGNFDISPQDISNTYHIIQNMWRDSKELQEAYPDYLQRLNKAMKSLEKKIKDKGYDFVKGLFDKVKFDEDNFIKLYEEYLTERMLKSADKLQSRKEEVPKDGTIAAISKATGVSVGDIIQKAESTNKDDVKWVYDQVTKLMDVGFENINKELKIFADAEEGEFKYRPSGYKKFERALEKYLKDKADPDEPVNDFFDLGDLLGFRGSFDSVDGIINFAIKVVEDTEYAVYKFKSYVGKGTPYQGINMNLNYNDEFNFECQSVMDSVQVATDINHDIFYKEIMKANSQQKKAVAMLVQIFIGNMFSEVFNFKK